MTGPFSEFVSARPPKDAPRPYCTGKKTPGGAGTHTGHARDTRAHTGTRNTVPVQYRVLYCTVPGTVPELTFGCSANSNCGPESEKRCRTRARKC